MTLATKLRLRYRPFSNGSLPKYPRKDEVHAAQTILSAKDKRLMLLGKISDDVTVH